MAVCHSFLYLVLFLFCYVSVTLKSKNWLRSGLLQRHTADFTNAMNDASLPLVPSVEPRTQLCLYYKVMTPGRKVKSSLDHADM